MSRTLTDIELDNWLYKNGYKDLISANKILQDVEGTRKRSDQDTGILDLSDTTFTADELAQAFIRRGYADYTTPLHVRKLIEDILAHREPEWKVGDVVRSASGVYYRRVHGNKWQIFGMREHFSHNTPTRPLTKIGPDQ